MNLNSSFAKKYVKRTRTTRNESQGCRLKRVVFRQPDTRAGGFTDKNALSHP